MNSERAELRILRAELLDVHREVKTLRGRVEQLVASNDEMAGQLAAASRRTDDLLKSNVVYRRLLEACDAAAALSAVEEILSNIVGTEDFVILATTDQAALRPIAGMGISMRRAGERPPTLDELSHGHSHVVPLYVAEHVVGAIVIGELMLHREPLGHADDQVLTLLSRFAASAMIAADERKHWHGLPLPAVPS